MQKEKVLLFLFDVNGVLSQSRAKLLDTKLFTARTTLQRIVVIAGLFADEMHTLFLLLALCHGLIFFLFVRSLSLFGFSLNFPAGLYLGISELSIRCGFFFA